VKKGLRDWVEIFWAGKHTDSQGRKREFTAADLDRMVSGYDPAQHETPAVVGHLKDNAPAYGWVEGALRPLGVTFPACRPKNRLQGVCGVPLLC